MKSLNSRSAFFAGKCFLIVFVGVTSLCCAAASVEQPENIGFKSNAKEFSHPNGLRLNAPRNLTVNQDDDGFVVVPPSSRGMSEMEISLKDNTASESSLKQKRIGERTVNYEIERRAGDGSGGDEYGIIAVERIGNRTVEYRQGDQVETGEPSFDFFWSAVAATSFER